MINRIMKPPSGGFCLGVRQAMKRTQTNVRDQLANYRHVDACIDYYLLRIEFFSRFTNSTPALRHMVREQILDYQNRIADLKTLKEGIERTIKNVPLPYRDALYHRYIEGMTFSEIARKLHYSQSSVRRHIDRGIEIIEGGDIQVKT